MTAGDQRAALLRETLAGFGAPTDVYDELLAYTANPFETNRLDLSSLPLADGPQIEAWEEYARESRRDGVVPALARRLVQFRFPIEPGISQTDAYLAATRRGVLPSDDSPGLTLEDAGGIELVLHPTLGGRIPVITCSSRGDFVTLVRACSCRNEPELVPDSMGACIVNGLNNWDRVARLRRRLEAERGGPLDEREWGEAFRRLLPQKALYQDRMIILSRDPYSAVPADALGLDDDEWRKQSVAIRREHECTHYFTLVAFGLMRNNLLDELIADFAGLARTYGRYEARLALRFFGLEAYPDYRQGGRFENYLKTPPVEPAAAEILRGMVVRAARAVETFTAGMDLAAQPTCYRMIVALAGSNLVELSSDTAAGALGARLAAVPGHLTGLKR
jgi:hypothetical protein